MRGSRRMKHKSCILQKDVVIIPCAGMGRRLNLPYPKELLAVAPERVLIDYTFDLLRSHAHHVLVIVVVSIHKLETMRYLERYQDLFEMAFVYQKPDLTEATGAVLSAASWFGDRNIVLLPDQIIYLDNPTSDPIGTALEELTKSQFCFIATLETDMKRLAEDGALRLIETPEVDSHYQVVDFADKPGLQANGFNAVWAGFGFRRDQAIDNLLLMHRNTCGIPIDPNTYECSPLHRCPAVLIAGYEDLGIWPRVQNFWARSGEEK
jgi:NDP-sugar pyrophosphorylase family protein